MHKMIIKIDGVRDGDTIRAISSLGANWIGLTFNAESPNNIDMIPIHTGIMPDKADLSALHSPLSTPKRVGIFTDEMPQNIITRAVNYKLDFIQFDGTETPTLLRNLRHTLNPEICKGIQFIKNLQHQGKYLPYEDCTDFFIISLNMIDDYHSQHPFLVGGFTPDDAARIGNIKHPQFAGISLEDAFDKEPGKKDISLIESFLGKLI